MEFKEEVFKEMRRIQQREGYHWCFQQYMAFINHHVSFPMTVQEFWGAMEELCNEKYFDKEMDAFFYYILTEKGEKAVYA